MNTEKFNIPLTLQNLQNKILNLREAGHLELQNGDTGFANAPSNIALLKYWGKIPNSNQIPTNSSISYTLNGFRSFTKVVVLGRFFPKDEKNKCPKIQNRMLLKNEHQEIISTEINSKLNNFIDTILSSFAPEIGLHVESQNFFPTACGIASSASGYSALVGAIADLLQLKKHFSKEELQHWLFEWSRLGSGSATRSSLLSLGKPENELFVAWKLLNEKESYFTKTEPIEVHPNWLNLGHCVFVLDEKEKSVSSSEGHKSAQTSPLHAIRVANMPLNFERMCLALKEFDFLTVQNLTEEDAFAMHAVMQTGDPKALYLTQEVSQILSSFIEKRNKNKWKIFWTLDAGPNLHFLYQPQDEPFLMEFFIQIEQQLGIKGKVLKNNLQKESLILGKCNNEK